MRPVTIVEIGERSEMSADGLSQRFKLAVQENDGDIQDLITFDGFSIMNGSELHVCSSGFTMVKSVWQKINTVWCRIVALG